MALGSAALELAPKGPRQRHRCHWLLGPRVDDRRANSVLRDPQGLHQLNLTALLLGRLKLRLAAAPFLAHFGSLCSKNQNFRCVKYSFDWAPSPGAYAIRRHPRHAEGEERILKNIAGAPPYVARSA